MFSLLQTYFYSGWCNLVLLPVHLLIASSWVSCVTIFTRPLGHLAVSGAIFLGDQIFADQWHHGTDPIALSWSLSNMSLALEWLLCARHFSLICQNIPSLKPCLQQGMCYCNARCSRLRYYQCCPSIDGKNIYTDNHTTIQFSLDCVLFYAVKMYRYSLTIMSLSDTCVICSICQLFPCIVC